MNFWRILKPNFAQQKPHGYVWLLCLITVLVFGNTLFNGYNFDDNLVTQNHPLTSKGLRAVYAIYTNPYYTNNADIGFEYRPITHLSFAIEHQLFGESPFISHLVNLILYVCCVALFFKFITLWYKELSLHWAFLAALLFAIHPIHTEVVASIKNRDELLAFLFLILSFIQLYHFTLKDNIGKLILAALFFAIGMLSKKSIYPLVILVPLFLTFLSNLKTWRVLFATILFSVLAALTGSELKLNRLLILFVVPVAFSILIILLKKRKLVFTFIKDALNKQLELVFFSLTTAALVFSSIYYQDYVFFILATIINILFLYRFHHKMQILFYIIVQILLIGYFLDSVTLVKMALLLSCYTYLTDLRKKKLSILSVSIPLSAVILFLVSSNNITALIFTLLCIVTMYFIENKLVFTVFVILNLLVSLLFFNLNYFSILLVVLLLYTWFKNKSYIHIFRFEPILIGLLLPILFFKNTPITVTNNQWSNFIESQNYIKQQKQIGNTIQQNGKEKGRGFNYIENTLIGSQTLEAKFTTGIVTIGTYIKLLIIPYNLRFYYGYAITNTASFKNLWFWFWLTILASSMLLGIMVLNKNKLFFINLIWFYAGIILFSNWVEPVAGMVGERLAFTASAGFCITLVLALKYFMPNLGSKKIKLPEIIFAIVLVIISFTSAARNKLWNNPIKLMQHDMAYSAESAYGNYMYALNCLANTNHLATLNTSEANYLVKQAEKSLLKSIEIYPHFFHSNFELARLYISVQNYGQALIFLENCYRIDSTNLFALEELAKTSFDLNLTAKTIFYANKYLALFKQNENIYEILAYTYFLTKNYSQARQIAFKGLYYFPNGNNLNGLLKDINKNMQQQVKINAYK